MHTFAPRPSDPTAAAELSRRLGIHPVTAQVLAARGIRGEEEARRFLRPGPGELHAPALFRDMEAATALVARTIADGGRIVVYGDYDVDGVCGTAVLVRALRALGGRADAFLPHRVEDGYGLSGDVLARLRAEGCALVVTVDNGSTRGAEIARAQADGLAVVVTDHHEVGTDPVPCPFLNPKRPDTTYPFPGLAGCGVALKLALGLAGRMGRLGDAAFKALLPDLLATTAIGTVADVVPMRDENRSLVAMGLGALAATGHAGLRALLEVARCADRPVRSADIAFRLGPRINAAGRIGSAGLALDLLLCEEPEAAAALARRLDEKNQKRQGIERRQADEAFALAETAVAGGDVPALVLAREGWHPGVIGIVAARLAESFDRPAALIAVDGGTGRGSARSFGGVRLHEALERCTGHLLTHGGHAKAAGFTLEAGKIDAFREAFETAVREQGGAGAGPLPVDAELPLDAISLPLAAEIDALQPFGSGNEEPLFCAFGVRTAGKPRRGGPGDRRLIFYAASERSSVRAVARAGMFREEELGAPFDVAFFLRRRREGPDPVEIHVRALAPAR